MAKEIKQGDILSKNNLKQSNLEKVVDAEAQIFSDGDFRYICKPLQDGAYLILDKYRLEGRYKCRTQ